VVLVKCEDVAAKLRVCGKVRNGCAAELLNESNYHLLQEHVTFKHCSSSYEVPFAHSSLEVLYRDCRYASKVSHVRMLFSMSGCSCECQDLLFFATA